MGKIKRVKDHIISHKGSYFFGGLFVGAMAINAHASKEFTKFLIEKGIDPLEYFNPEALAESLEAAKDAVIDAVKELP